MSGSRLDEVRQVHLPAWVVPRTLSVLQEFGEDQLEGFLLWVGEIDGPDARIVSCLVPPQESIESESGVGYFLTTETLFDVNRYLAEKKLRLIAQVHSHPQEAYHSATDDRYAIATTEGAYSLVVPDFGQAPADPSEWAVYRLSGGEWVELDVPAVRRTFLISGS